ncbi:MAG: Stp1/IreP family PP2C-type Ser/Thr phosphatase [Candidatus Parabeggiatoa sp. nov. 2]|nr:MAG: hypothetical protein B6247_10365 [Beggiatoa sp. 4572_84]RKZ56311.1 MAG: Stp1/IreP family PP2C-type Ser/Thr phosphatase [Gammaproteobacteria bacterium]HEC83709.1 Stp1/IreP family PP2C-type Ser/Thr phosphatase [Thioploca sp.]
MCIEMVCRTDTGRIRQHNEDCLGGDESLGLVALADGMGGYQAGEVASEMAVKIIIKQLYASIKSLLHAKRRTSYRYHSATVLLEQAVLKANQAIYEMGEQQARYQGMGTTVVAVLFHNHLMSVAHVGDSRLYRLRGNDFRQITKDHSVRQELIDCGLYTPEQARNSPNKNLVTRALGVGEQVDVEVQEERVLAQDIYLLCSDGLSDMLNDSDMHSILCDADTLEQAAQLLIDAANAKGGRDNISLVLVRPLSVAAKPRKGWLRRLFGRN